MYYSIVKPIYFDLWTKYSLLLFFFHFLSDLDASVNDELSSGEYEMEEFE